MTGEGSAFVAMNMAHLSKLPKCTSFTHNGIMQQLSTNIFSWIRFFSRGLPIDSYSPLTLPTSKENTNRETDAIVVDFAD